MARLGVLVGGRVRKLHAVKDHSASILEEITSKLEGMICNLVRRPQWDQQGCHSRNEDRAQAWKDHIINARSMRAVKGSLGHSL